MLGLRGGSTPCRAPGQCACARHQNHRRGIMLGVRESEATHYSHSSERGALFSPRGTVEWREPQKRVLWSYHRRGRTCAVVCKFRTCEAGKRPAAEAAPALAPPLYGSAREACKHSSAASRRGRQGFRKREIAPPPTTPSASVTQWFLFPNGEWQKTNGKAI